MIKASLYLRATFFFVLSVMVFLFANTAKAEESSRPVPSSQTIAKQAIMLDYDTGMVLLAKNPDEKMPTSSMSKTMTLYMVFEALKEGRYSLGDKFKVSKKAWKKGGSKMFVEVDSAVAIEDLIRGVAIQSGNDATIVLAEGLMGSEDSFAEAITNRAHALGMDNTHFANASGWPDPNHYSTARDLAILGKHLISDFSDYYHYFSETEFTYNNIRQQNRNPLLFRGIGADGIKTGHTEDGGYGLIGSGTHNGRRVVLVVNGLADDKERAQESARLLEWGLKAFQNVSLFKQGDIVEYAYVVMGEKEQVPLVIDQDLTVTIPVAVRNDLRVEVEYKEPFYAPVKKGDQVGTLHVSVPRVTALEIPLYAGESVKELGFLATTLVKAKLLFGGKLF